MLDDFILLTHSFKNAPFINIYPLGDVHLGSKECNLDLLKEWVDTVKNDPFGYAVIIGDLMNMGLKNSKTNVYEEVLSPMEQKDLCYVMRSPSEDKIRAGCSGNDE